MHTAGNNGNLHDMHIRDINNFDLELQLGNNYGLLNSKTMEICLCNMKEMSTTLKNCNCGIAAVYCSVNRKSLRELTETCIQC